ncbi:TetR/AcrR family transcriptional regulator [Mycolicibacterium phlei]|uniref:TetR/AcrR family transcriptional regulator n=1 Tax=Mycolicibacterium phlei TaxID=1771 RepID=UPI00103A8185|nr:TetR/AcrR family transcriptional regulator [Mycolicibacterium phlei]
MTTTAGRNRAARESGAQGRPRDPSTEDRVYNAAKQELAERGFEGFSMRSVARRSGVARPSLTLRWPTRDALIMDTLERLAEWPEPRPEAGVRAEIEAVAARSAELLGPDMLAIQLRLVADAPRHPELFAAFQDRVMVKAGKRLTTLFEQAAAEGHLRPGISARWASDALMGVLFMRTIMTPGQKPPSPAVQREILEALWVD